MVLVIGLLVEHLVFYFKNLFSSLVSYYFYLWNSMRSSALAKNFIWNTLQQFWTSTNSVDVFILTEKFVWNHIKWRNGTNLNFAPFIVRLLSVAVYSQKFKRETIIFWFNCIGIHCQLWNEIEIVDKRTTQNKRLMWKTIYKRYSSCLFPNFQSPKKIFLFFLQVNWIWDTFFLLMNENTNKNHNLLNGL